MKKIIKTALIILITCLCVPLIFLFLTYTGIAKINQLQNEGMYPSIQKGQYVISTNLIHDYSKGDIVLYRIEQDSSIGHVDRISRIKSVGGEVIEDINGNKKVVPNNSYYLVMDEDLNQIYNRYGFTPDTDILGKVVFIFGKESTARF